MALEQKETQKKQINKIIEEMTSVKKAYSDKRMEKQVFDRKIRDLNRALNKIKQGIPTPNLDLIKQIDKNLEITENKFDLSILLNKEQIDKIKSSNLSSEVKAILLDSIEE